MSVSIRRNVVSNWVGLAFRMVAGFFILPWVIRTVGKDAYGQYQLLIAVFGSSTMLDMGLRAAVLRYVAQLSAAGETERLNRILGSAFAYYAMIGVMLVGAGSLVYAWHRPWMLPEGAEPSFPALVLLFSIGSAINFFRITWQSVVWARERYDVSNLIEIITFTVRSTLLVILLLQGMGVVVVVLADIFEYSMSLLLHRLVSIRMFPEIRPRWRGARGDDLRSVTGYSFWAFLNALSTQLRFRSPNLVLGWTMNTTAVTIFSVAGRAQAYLFQVNTAMSSPFRARMSALAGRNDREGLTDLLFRGTRWVALLSFTLCGALWVHADRFMYAWMGPEFGPSGVVLRILLPGLALHMSQLVLFNGLYAIGRHQWLSVITMIEAVALVACGLLLVGQHGLSGVAMGVTIPVVLNKLTLQPIYSCRAMGVGVWEWFRKGLLRPTLVVLIAAPIVYGFEQLWTARSLAGVLLQLALSVIPFAVVGWFVALDRSDRAAVVATLGSVRRAADRWILRRPAPSRR